MKMWAGRFKKEINEAVNDFNSSISFDSKLYKEDIKGSIAHATMLGATGVIDKSEADKIISELGKIESDIDSGKIEFDMTAEDIHMFIESELTKRLGLTGKRLHTARSRNDQVAVDMKLYAKRSCDDIAGNVKELCETLINIAKNNLETVMPGYTHLQRAQPVTFSHYMMAYAQMFLRDLKRISSTKEIMDECPLGSGALATTTYPIDRVMTSELLGFRAPVRNSLDGVSDRDFCIQLASDISILMMHMSRLCEEIVLWCSWEFKFIELDDAYATGSSIMPQKKNPDISELIRGKTGRCYGNLITLLTMMKGIPLAYNKDMQEDKEAVFDSVETALLCTKTLIPMLKTMTVMKNNMRKAAAKGFINATDCADYLVKKGLPFRDAYKCVGELVAYCIDESKTLEELSLTEYNKVCELFSDDIYNAISLDTCVNQRNTLGGPSKEAVMIQIKDMEEKLLNFKL